MRASRLLQMLLLLQSRGRMTSAQLAAKLEVARRTVLRDVDALTEAGLPIIVHQGNQGGIELGFNYRTRLTGLDAEEAEAVAVMLSRPISELAQLGLSDAANRARGKIFESLPDSVRSKAALARERFRFEVDPEPTIDPRIPALADAVRQGRAIRINVRSRLSRTILPVGLVARSKGWFIVLGAPDRGELSLEACGDISVVADRME